MVISNKDRSNTRQLQNKIYNVIIVCEGDTEERFFMNHKFTLASLIKSHINKNSNTGVYNEVNIKILPFDGAARGLKITSSLHKTIQNFINNLESRNSDYVEFNKVFFCYDGDRLQDKKENIKITDRIIFFNIKAEKIDYNNKLPELLLCISKPNIEVIYYLDLYGKLPKDFKKQCIRLKQKPKNDWNNWVSQTDIKELFSKLKKHYDCQQIVLEKWYDTSQYFSEIFKMSD